MEENRDMVEDIQSGSSDSGSDSFIDDSEVDEVSISGQDDGLHLEACSESWYLFLILAVLYFRHEDRDCSCLIMVKHDAFL